MELRLLKIYQSFKYKNRYYYRMEHKESCYVKWAYLGNVNDELSPNLSKKMEKLYQDFKRTELKTLHQLQNT